MTAPRITAWRLLLRMPSAVLSLAAVLFYLLLAAGTEGYSIYCEQRGIIPVYQRTDDTVRYAPPSREHWMGTDYQGRDVLLRAAAGSATAVKVGVIASFIAVFIGVTLGAIAGFYGGKVDNVIMRIMDVFMACPFILLAMAIVAALGASIVNLLIALGVSGMASFSRVTRAAVMSVKDKEFVESARAVGANDIEILFKYILPNAMAPILVQFTLRIGSSILNVAGLSYIGLGVQPPLPEWGAILTAAKVYMRDAWHISVFPGLFLVITVVAFNLFGDGLRDALDPKLKR